QNAAAALGLQHPTCPRRYRCRSDSERQPQFSSRPRQRRPRGTSLQDLRHHARADCAAALADRKAQALFHRNRADQLHRHLHIVARHHHLNARRQIHRTRHVRRAEVKLRTIPLEERRVTSTLLLRQHVHLTLKLRVRRDRASLRQHLTTLHFLALRTSQQHTHVVARSPLIQKLAEHLPPRAGRLLRLPKTNNLNLVVHLDDTALHPPRHHRATTRNREHVLNRHQERLVNLALRHRNVPVHLLNQLQNRRNSNLRLIPLQRLQRTALHNRRRVTREVVLRQKLPNLHLHQLEKLRIVHHVRLVQKHHDVRHAHLTRQQNMLARLRHRTIRRRYHQNRTVHLRRTRDHVLHIVRMPRTVHVRVV